MRELTDKESSVTRCDSLRREVSVQQVQGQQNSTKTFTFDKVCCSAIADRLTAQTHKQTGLWARFSPERRLQ